MDPVQLQNCCVSWTWAIAELLPGEAVASDRKTARRSFARAGKKGAIHIRSLTNRVPGPPGRARPWAKACPVLRHGVKTDEITAILRNERTLKVGIQGKGLNAGWDEDYLLKVLLG